MADNTSWGIVNPQQTQNISRQRALADALRQQSMQGQNPTQSAGRYIVPFSPMQGVRQLGQAFGSGMLNRRANEGQSALNLERQALVQALGGKLFPDNHEMQQLFVQDPEAGIKIYQEQKKLAETERAADERLTQGQEFTERMRGVPQAVMPQTPTDIQEYQLWEKQGGKGGLAGFMRFKASLTPQAKAEYGPTTPKASKGEEARDREFAKEYVDFQAKGGYADIKKGLDQLRSAQRALGSGKNLTGPVLGMTPDFVKAFTHPEAISNRELVEEVAQRNLRIILGAQFTQKEGERLIARAYNESLGEAENAKRVGRLLKQIELAAQSKQDASEYFEKHGTLSGWSGKVPTITDFYESIENTALDESAAAPAGAAPAAPTAGGFRVVGKRPK